MLNVIVLLVFAASIIYGLKQGIIRQLGSLAATVCALIACRVFGGFLEGVMPGEPAFAAPLLSNALTFIAVYVAVAFLFKAMRVVTHALMLGMFDRVAGALFCMFKWLLGLSILLNVWTALSGKPFENPSQVSQGVVKMAPWLWGVVSAQHSSLPDGYNKTDRTNESDT